MISVIVPIYNVERYLRRALDSIIAQTHQDWEAILVDDGSTDQSGHIADEYAKKDPRFRVVHKENGGLSDARNAGMKEVKGQWVVYLDSDDFLHPQLMELCLEAALRDGSDIVAYTYDHYYRTRNLVGHFIGLPDSRPRPRTYSNPPYLATDNIYAYATEYSKPKDIERRWAVKHCQVWRCMYRTDIIRDIPFIRGINYEDFPWWSEVLLHIRRATILNLPLYYYYPNPRSYILSAKRDHKAHSMEIGIEAARKVYENAPDDKRACWENRFLAPFEGYLAKKKRQQH